ncbi:thioesterase family protein [Ancylomarina sp. YFZ004]
MKQWLYRLCKLIHINKLTEVDGKKLTFEIEATDEDGPICSSLHKRYVIDPIKFMARA